MLDWFETPNGFLLVMERAYKCITLYKLLKRLDGKLPEEMARIIMWKLVKAVNHCRKSGVLHEDIKTDNILVNPETLELKLVDFGLVTIIKDIRLNEFGGNFMSGISRFVGNSVADFFFFFIISLMILFLCLSFRQ